MNLFRTLLQRLKAWLLTLLGAGVLTALLVLSGITARADIRLYDVFSQLVAPNADPRIVVVKIDAPSLAELGQWPWSRRVHAQLIDRLTHIGTRGIALDLPLTESALHDPEGDALLARALERNNHTVLPVIARSASDGTVFETLPIPEFTASAAALGHVDHAPGLDGVSRGMYLHAGLGTPRWPSLVLALRNLQGGTLPELQGFDASGDTSQHWARSDYTLLPSTHPANGLKQFSYADMLAGRVADEALRDCWILVGIDAAGMGNTMVMPGHRGKLADIHYQANALNVLVNHAQVTPLGNGASIALASLLASLPVLLFGLPGLSRSWRVLAIAVAATLLLPLVLLPTGYWFPPLPALLTLAAGLLLWRRRRMLKSYQLAQTNPLTGLANHMLFEKSLQRELDAARHSGLPLSILLVDADHFRQFVASCGRDSGNVALRLLADILRNRARRPRDLVAQIAYDRFSILLPETSAHAAAVISTALHVDLAGLPDKSDTGLPANARLTVSIGIHTVTRNGTHDTTEAMNCAEAALYQAKQLGHNRSFVYTENTTAPRPAS